MPATSDADVDAISAVLSDVVYRRGRGIPHRLHVSLVGERIKLHSDDLDADVRSTTTFSGDPSDVVNVLDNLTQHFASAAASEALASLTYRGHVVHDTTTEGEPHVVIPPRLIDLETDPDRATMLAERRAREATGPTFIADSDDPELDALDAHLASVEMRWPGATVAGLWGERWADLVQPNGPGGLRYGHCGRGDLYVCSDGGRINSDTGRPFGHDSAGRVVSFHPATPFRGDPYNRDDVIAAATRHVAWFAAHESLERATVDGAPLYDPHKRGEVEITIPGLVPA